MSKKLQFRRKALQIAEAIIAAMPESERYEILLTALAEVQVRLWDRWVNEQTEFELKEKGLMSGKTKTQTG